MREVTIRPYKPADFNSVTSLWLDSWNSAGVRTPVTETLTSLRRRFVQEEVSWSIHIAAMRLRAIGFVALRGDKVEQLFVDPAAQSRGVGKSLLDFVKQERSRGFWLLTQAQNHGARRFYEREGLTGGKIMLGRHSGYRIIRYDWRPERLGSSRTAS